MSFPVTIPFYAFKIHLLSGSHIFTPMADPQSVRVGDSLKLIAQNYATEFQEKVLNKGTYNSLLDEYRRGEFIKSSLKLYFPAAKDRISYPAFELEFEYFYSYCKTGVWGIVPSLNIESFADEFETLVRRLEDGIRTHFVRNKRLQFVRMIISDIWYDTIELLSFDIQLEMLSPKELEENNKVNKTKLLPKVARPLKAKNKVVYGRKKELDQILRGLKNKFSRNIILVGVSGVGKTALIWEAARHLQKSKNKIEVWETTASTLIKELTRATGWQDNLAYLCQELSQSEDLLFIRNLMELFEVGKYEGNSVSIAEYLRSYISRGEITVLTECTEEELARIELRSPNYLSFFQIIRLEEPTEQLENIILKKINDIASNQKIRISEEAIKEILRLNKRFSPYAGMPGKPIRFLESLLINRKNPGVSDSKKKNRVDRTEIIDAFCEESGMPPFMVDPQITMDTRLIRKEFNENVFGQEEAVDSLVSILASVKTALTRTGKPIASFFFVGPTGVGKTELAKVLAKFMFGQRSRLIRFDMSEYSSPYAIMRLIGTDYNSDGILTSAIRREPFAVLLFDEIEKAHANFYDLLLQILSEGRLTDSQGKLVNFCSTIIIMTSNIGAERLQSNKIGWKNQLEAVEVKDHFMTAIQKYFRPELLNRIDDIIPFEPLDKITIRFIVDREIKLLKNREGIKFRKIFLRIEEEVLDFLGEQGYHPKYGARYLQRTVREKIIIPLAYKLNDFDFDDQLIVNILQSEKGIDIDVEADPLGLDLLIEELDMINHADHASSLRRQVIQLMEGALFVRLLSELDILEREKKRLKNKFWDIKKNAERYTYYLQTRENINNLLEENEKYELSLNLAALNLEPYQPEMVENLKQWETKFFQLKKDIYSQMTPKANQCHLGVYGTDLEPLIQFYQSLFVKKEFYCNAQAIWFREAYYNEEVILENGTSQKREEYIKTAIDLSDLANITPEHPKDNLYGIEFAISGNCAYLYLKEEDGYQRWSAVSSLKEARNYAVIVLNEPFETPKKIHRKEFYSRQNLRRSIDGSILKDNIYKINREVPESNLVEYLYQKLEERFVFKLQLEVM